MSRNNMSTPRAQIAQRFKCNIKGPGTRVTATTLALLVLQVVSDAAWAQSDQLFPGLGAISESDIRESAVGFVNMATSPGLEGATLEVDQNNRRAEQWRSSLGFGAEFTLKKPVFNGYWGLALLNGGLQDEITLIADDGQPARIDLTREVVALRGSLGLVFPVDEHFKIRPYLSVVGADLRSESVIDDIPTLGTGAPTRTRFKTSATLLSTVGTLDAYYGRWYGSNKLEVGGQFNVIYSDSVSEDNPILNAQSWNRTAQIKAKYSGPTSMVSAGRPWRWQTYANYTNFLSINELTLGYNRLIEFGAGIDWQMNIKPLDWFGWRAIGWRFGVILGDDVVGYNIGVTAQ